MEPTAPDKTVLEAELQKIYDSEINVRISWVWDSGITLRLGDEMNGFVAEEIVRDVSEIAPWFQEAIAHFYPTSTYAQSLSFELRQRAAVRVFVAPHNRARAICPHCGTANTLVTDETLIYICPHCGDSGEAERSFRREAERHSGMIPNTIGA